MGQCINFEVGNDGSVIPAAGSPSGTNVNMSNGGDEEEEEEEDDDCLTMCLAKAGCALCL
jgi:hypothetical protein